MREEFEIYDDADEPLARGRAEEDAEPDIEQELLRAVQAEMRESVILPGVPLS